MLFNTLLFRNKVKYTRILFALTRKIIPVKLLKEHGLWDNQENYVPNTETVGLTLKT